MERRFFARVVFCKGWSFARGGLLQGVEGLLQGVVFCKGWSFARGGFLQGVVFAMERRVCFCNERFFAI